MNQILICKYSSCKKYLSCPVILPCGRNICNEHIQELTDSFQLTKFKCHLCKREHEMPENGFLVNLELEEILKLNLHLNEDQKNCIVLLEKLDSILNRIDLIYNDPPNFVYDYFSNLKNEIEKERERLKSQIDSIALDMINMIDDYEKECKSKKKILSPLNQDSKIERANLRKELSGLKNELRETDIEITRCKQLTETIKKYLTENQNEIDKIQNELLLEKRCHLKIKKFDFTNEHFADFNIADFNPNQDEEQHQPQPTQQPQPEPQQPVHNANNQHGLNHNHNHAMIHQMIQQQLQQHQQRHQQQLQQHQQQLQLHYRPIAINPNIVQQPQAAFARGNVQQRIQVVNANNNANGQQPQQQQQQQQQTNNPNNIQIINQQEEQNYFEH